MVYIREGAKSRIVTTWHFLFFFTVFNEIVSEPPRIVPFSFGSDVVDEGAFAQLTCVVSHGDEPISITWSLKGDVISSEPTISTTMVGTRTSFLIIQNVGYRHSGDYTCTARNRAGVTSHSTTLRVNGSACS